jgi:F0F1-type ATP synthase assembly protein I
MPHPSFPDRGGSGGSTGARNQDRGNKNTIALNAFSRVMAVLLLMLLVGVGGSFLDKWLGTGFLTLTGFLVGGAIAIVGMMYVVRAAEFERKEQKANDQARATADFSEPDRSVDGTERDFQ